MSGPSGAAEEILFLSPEPPYPLAGGGQMRSASLLHYLAQRAPVHLITFKVEGDADPTGYLPQGLVARSTVIELPRHSKDWTSKALRNTARLMRGRTPLLDRFGEPASVAAVAESLDGGRYRLAVIEHFWCAPYVDLVRRHADRVVLDLHNIESVLHAGCARSESPLERLGHEVFSRHSTAAERKLLPKFDLVLTASDLDAARVCRLAPAARTAVYPNAIPLRPKPNVEERPETIVFSGNLEYHPNVSAVRFFKREVWPTLRAARPNLVWRLIGKNEHAVRRITADDPRIELSGPIPDAVEELAKATLVVVPLLAGSGTRVKIMEAWAAARAVVSSSVGAEGLPASNTRNLIVVDSPSGWAEQVIELLDQSATRRLIGDNGRHTYEQSCNWPAAWRLLETTLEPFATLQPAMAVKR